jgi:hypothetical protein
MNRRNFLLGAAALSTTPAFSLDLPKVVDFKTAAELAKYKKMFTEHLLWHQSGYDLPKSQSLDEVYSLAEKVCHTMVDLRPEMFIDHTMCSPATMVLWPNVDGLDPMHYEFHTAIATSRHYKLNIPPDYKDHEWIAGELLNELDREIRANHKRYRKYGPSSYASQYIKNPLILTTPPEMLIYMPAIPIRAVYAHDFSPYISFRVRYAWTYGKSRVLRVPDDLYIEQAQWKAREAKWAEQGGI